MNSFKTKVTFVVHKANSSSSINSEFPDGTMVKNPAADAGDIRDVSSIPGLGRSPGEGDGNPLQHSCLENPMDRGAWGTTVQRVKESWTQLSTAQR